MIPVEQLSLTKISKSQWKVIKINQHDFFFHIPTSYILQAPKHLMQSAKKNNSSTKILDKLKKFEQTYIKKDHYPKPNITSIALNVIEKCNLKCSYCYAGDGSYGNESIMNLSLAKKAILMFRKSKTPFRVIFFGGEPLLNFPLIKEIVSWCEKDIGIYRYSITTNGVLLTKDIIDFFKKHNFSLKISYDGKKIQQKQRFNSEKVKDIVGIKLKRFSATLKSLRSFHLRATVIKTDISQLQETVLEILSSFNYRLMVSKVSSPQKNELMTQEDIHIYGENLKGIVTSLVKTKDWKKLFRIQSIKAHIANFHRAKQKIFCKAGINYLSVSTRGEFFLCHRFTEDREACIGNLNEGINFDKVAKIKEFRQAQHEPCNSCWMKEQCKGGCFHEHQTGSGNKLKIDSTFCKIQDVEMSLALWLYIYLRTNHPEIIEEEL